MNNQPLISVITVSYNAASIIEQTILSVINQTYSNIEYIIIDGGSTDGTIDVIKKYQSKISYWISEPDKGIYDAMNKGIKIATGDWINFMNCGDSFYTNQIIEEIFCTPKDKYDVIYGNTNLLLPEGEYIQKGEAITSSKYMPFVHQASFSNCILMKNNLFDTTFKICADRKFFYDVLKLNGRFCYVDKTFVNYEGVNGFSSTNIVKLLYEIGMIEGKTDKLSWKIYYKLYTMLYAFKQYLKTVLPICLVNKIKEYNLRRLYS